MGWKTKLAVPALASLGYLVASFFVKVVPCQISPNIPNPSYSWALCTLNPDKSSLFGVREVYWGITSQLSETYLITLGLIFICLFLFLAPFTHKKSNFKDKKNTERRFETY
ncbi:MAG: hypothetical protein WCI72_02045 [archaeon]